MRIIEFVTDQGPDAGYASLAAQFNVWAQNPATSVEILQATITRRNSIVNGQDQYALMVLYREISLDVRISYTSFSQTDMSLDFPAWFAAATDALAPGAIPVFVLGADMVTAREAQAGKQYLFITIDQATNPFNLGTKETSFIGYPAALIGPLATGPVDLIASDGTVVGQYLVRNVHPTNAWAAGVPSYVVMDGLDVATANLMATPLCNCV